MQLPPRDWRRATHSFLRGDAPFGPPAGRTRQLPRGNPFDGLPGDFQTAFQRAPLHAPLVLGPYITYDEAMSTFP